MTLMGIEHYSSTKYLPQSDKDDYCYFLFRHHSIFTIFVDINTPSQGHASLEPYKVLCVFIGLLLQSRSNPFEWITKFLDCN